MPVATGSEGTGGRIGHRHLLSYAVLTRQYAMATYPVEACGRHTAITVTVPSMPSVPQHAFCPLDYLCHTWACERRAGLWRANQAGRQAPCAGAAV